MKNLMNKFFKEEEGNIIEYIIVLAVIAVVIAALFPGLRGRIMDWFSSMIGNVDDGIGNMDCSANGMTLDAATQQCVLPAATTEG